MDVKDINKGLVVYHDRLGLLVVDNVLPDGRVSCSKGSIIVYPHLLSKVDKGMLKSRGVTDDDLKTANAHI